MSSYTPSPRQIDNSAYSSDIDLFYLFQSIWQEKKLIAIITGIITVLAFAYVMLATPVYQVQSIVKPTAIKDLDELNGTDIYKLSPEDALILVGASLESYETRLGYFKANQELFKPLTLSSKNLEQTFERLHHENIKVLKTDVKKGNDFSNSVGIQFQYPKGVDGAAITNGLVRYAVNLEKQRIAVNLDTVINNQLDRLKHSISNARAGYQASKEAQIAQLTENDTLKKAQLTDELKTLREELKERRQHRIKELDEAILIAKSLGIYKPATLSSLAKETRLSGNVIRTEVNNQQNPLYFMGTEMLEAERDVLMARSNDDFTSSRIIEINSALKLLEHNRQVEVLNARENEDLFLSELAESRKEITRLKNLKVNMDKLNLVRIDQVAIEPVAPVKPKKLFIIAVAIVLGGILGVFTALIRSMIRKRKEQEAQAQTVCMSQ